MIATFFIFNSYLMDGLSINNKGKEKLFSIVELMNLFLKRNTDESSSPVFLFYYKNVGQ